MATKSLDLWEQFAKQSGEQTGFTRCCLLYLSNDEKELAGWARWGEFARTVGVQTYMLTAQQAAERGKATGKQWKGGVYAPTDGTADPSRAAPAVARAIMALGGTVHQGCAARGLKPKVGDCPLWSLSTAPFVPGLRYLPEARGLLRSVASTVSVFPKPLFARR